MYPQATTPTTPHVFIFRQVLRDIFPQDGCLVYTWCTNMMHRGFKQRFFTKVLLKVKKGIMGKKLVTKNMAFFATFSCSLCKFRNREIKMKALNTAMIQNIRELSSLTSLLWQKKRLFISIDIRKSPMLGGLRHPINKAGSTTSFSPEDAFPNVSLSPKKTETFLEW